MDSWRQDLRYAARVLIRNPGLTVVAALSLALGIGANTTIFTWVRAVLLDPLPGVPDGGSLAVLTATDPRGSGNSLSYPDYLDYRQSPALAGLITQNQQVLSLAGDGRADRIWALIVSDNYFDVLGVRAAVGHTFLERGTARSGGAEVVISYGLWQRRFGGDPEVVGRKVTLNTHPFTIVGVAPPEFKGTVVALSLDAWLPLAVQPQFLGGDGLMQRGSRWLQALARLKPGVGLAQAQADLDVIARRLAETYPEDRGLGVTLYRFWNAPTGASRALGPVLLVLLAVVALVLLIACANVASLLIARATARRREIAVRLSLGASRVRLVRQLLTESVLLALLGGGIGVLIAFWGAGLLIAFVPPTDRPLSLDPGVEATAVAFTVLVSVLAGIAFGLSPALQATRADVAGTLRLESATLVGTRARGRDLLVVGQVALSLVLLVAAGLLLRSLHNARTVDPGFNPRDVLMASVDLMANGYEEERGRLFFRQALERVSVLPGVESASLTRRAPLGAGGSSSSTLMVEGYEPPEGQPAWALHQAVGPGYFRTLQSALVRGRDFDERDRAGAPAVAVINQTMAHRYWGGRDPLGGRIGWNERWFTVVGVARDARYRSLSEPPPPFMFVPLEQAYTPQATLLLRAKADPEALAPSILAELEALDGNLPVFNVRTLEEHVSASSFQQRMASWLFGAFGLLALTLAAVGLYGVLAFSVGQRTREIGIRMALGGERAEMFRLIVRHGLGLTALGVCAGLGLAAAGTRAVSGLLVGVSPTDPATFGGVALLLTLVALLACFVPARRAARVDPMTALRYE